MAFKFVPVRLEKITGQERMSDNAPPAARFLVRQGSKGWMVYDRQRKGPALVGTNPAVNLTKEKAEHIVGSLADPKPKNSISNADSLAWLAANERQTGLRADLGKKSIP